MSTNRNRAKLGKAENGNVYRKLWIDELYPPYCDEGITLYPLYRRGFKNPGKRLMSFQVRMYKTWKHNRKTQWKTAG